MGPLRQKRELKEGSLHPEWACSLFIKTKCPFTGDFLVLVLLFFTYYFLISIFIRVFLLSKVIGISCFHSALTEVFFHLSTSEVLLCLTHPQTSYQSCPKFSLCLTLLSSLQGIALHNIIMLYGKGRIKSYLSWPWKWALRPNKIIGSEHIASRRLQNDVNRTEGKQEFLPSKEGLLNPLFNANQVKLLCKSSLSKLKSVSMFLGCGLFYTRATFLRPWLVALRYDKGKWYLEILTKFQI